MKTAPDIVWACLLSTHEVLSDDCVKTADKQQSLELRQRQRDCRVPVGYLKPPKSTWYELRPSID